VVVAILDDGLDFNHPDLAANAFVNTGEIANNGIDDDNNGYIDDRRGWDFATGLPGDNDPSVDAPDDAHGIAVTGIIAARGNNNVGVAGVAYNTRWFTARIFEGPVSTDDLTIAAAINYASGRPGPTGVGWAGAAITNNSWGGGSPNAAMTDALAWGATNGRGGRGVLHVFSAGNAGRGAPAYPASLAATLPNVICVGASDDRDRRSTYSNHGAGLDLLAPSNGGTYSIVTTDRIGADGYDPGEYAGIDRSNTGFGGTSAAAPLTAGVAALVLAQAPTLTAPELRQLLRATTDRVGGDAFAYDQTYPATSGTPATLGADFFHGFGRINAFKALRGTSAPRVGVYLRGTTIARNGAVAANLFNGAVAANLFNGETNEVAFHVRNESAHTLEFSAPSVTGTFLSLVDASPVSLAPGQIHVLRLRATPTVRGSGSATINFATNAPGAATYPFTLNWTVVQGAVRGRIIEDADANLLGTADEPGLPGRLVFMDANNNNTRDPGPIRASADVPKDIPSGDEFGTFLETEIFDSGLVENPVVRLSVTHPRISEVELILHAPDGTTVQLVKLRGGFGANMTNTELSDLATTPISEGRAPFTGAFRPESPLSVLVGKPRAGKWRLQALDEYSNPVNDGSVTAWSLELGGGEPFALSGPDGGFRIPTVPVGNYRLRVQPTAGWQTTLPTAPAYLQSNIPNLDTSLQNRDFLQRRNGRVQGRVFDDLNTSATYDANEPGLPGLAVFADLNDDGQPGDISLGRIDATAGLPLTIPDQTIRTANLQITSDAQLTRIKVVLADLRHTLTNHFIITLIHPDGTRVRLVEDLYIEGFDITDLILDDAAEQPLAALPEESIVATGTYRPTSPLAPLLGKSVRGTWKLEVEDFFPNFSGSLHAWALQLEGREPRADTDAVGRYTLDALTVASTRLRVALPEGRTLISPAVAFHAVTLDPGQLGPVLDFAVGPAAVVPADFGIRTIRFETDRVVLEVIGVPLRAHRVQRREDLVAGDWVEAGTVTPGAEGVFIWQDPLPLPAIGRQFYRVVSP
jgi:subtilisin-like proprotein convertase family protein